MKYRLLLSAVSLPILLLTSCPHPDSMDTLSVGLTAYYPFNGNAEDVSGNGCPTGVLTNVQYTPQRDGDANKAISFNGTNAYLDIAKKHFTATNRLTVAFWVNVPSASVSVRYFMMCSDFGVAHSPDGIGLAISVPVTNSAKAVVTASTWHHIAGTYDGNIISIYLDGQLAESTTHPGTIAETDDELHIGHYNTTYWEGKIDDVRIYSRVLTQEEIEALVDFED